MNKAQVKQLKSKNKTYEYDFYVDCTGFARLLIGKLGSKWQSYSKFLKMKEAIVFPTREETEIPMWTLARAMNSGWMFLIPVWGEKVMVIFLIVTLSPSFHEAKIEAEKYLGFEVDVAKHIKFHP